MAKKTAYYMRTSHYLQNIATQVDKIEPGWKVYEDSGISGRIPFEERPAGKRLLEDCRNGKIERIVVLRLDRCGRSTQNILETLSTLNSLKIPLTSLNEGITTLDDNGNQTPTTGLLLSVLSSLSEFFYLQNREKTLIGLQLARQNHPERFTGRKLGAVESLDKYLNKPKTKKMMDMLKQGTSIRSITRVLECSPNSVYKLKKLIAEGKTTAQA